ncbi:redoxin domain-containing protein [Puteibacter caeruleilacunae]|nr:redoxin domain-containing protein [Puteibacter caeruleilacunae]
MNILIKTLLLTIFISVTLSASSKEVTIIGISHGFETGELVVRAEKDYVIQIEDDKFEITIPLKTSPQRIYLKAPKMKRLVPFYAESGVMKVEVFKKGFVKNTHFTGSEAQDIKCKFDDALKNDWREFRKQLSVHLNTLPGVHYLTINMKSIPVEEVKELYSRIEEPFKESAKYIRAYLNTCQIEPMDKGAKAYSFSWDNNDQAKKLSDFQGKYVLLNFTATGCHSCWKAYDGMNELEEAHGDKIKVISLHVDDSKEAWYKMAKRMNINFKCKSLWNIAKKDEVIAVYKIDILPTFILIDKSGKIIDRWAGSLRSKKILREID